MHNLSSVGRLLSQAWAIYAERMKTLLVLVGLGWALSVVGALLAIPSLVGIFSSVQKEGITDPGLFGASVGWGALLFIALMIAWTWIEITLAYAVSDGGKGESIGSLLRRSAKKIVPALVVSILFGLTIVAGFALFIVPAVFFALWFWASGFIVLFEDKEGLEALRQSKRYMKGLMSPVLVRLLFVWLFALALGLLTSMVEGMFGLNNENGSGFLASLIGSLFAPLWISYTYLLYKEIRHSPSASAPPADPLAPVSTM